MAVGLRFHPKPCFLFAQKLVNLNSGRFTCCSLRSSLPKTNHHQFPTRLLHSATTHRKSTQQASSAPPPPPPNVIPSSSSTPVSKDFPLSGLDDAMMGFFFGKLKATEVAHTVWKKIIRKGDTVVDATCGNGNDTLAMAKIVAQMSPSGHVYAMDVQQAALESTSSLLDESLHPDERRLVELFATCHSNMEDIIPKGSPVRLVAFNLGYLPGGDKSMITTSETTLKAMEAATRMLAPGGLISLVVYVGHPGGREEFEAVEAFASKLPVENWTCCKLQMLNRPLAPVLVLLFKR